MTLEWIRFILGTICLLFGLFFLVSAVIGNFRFKFALNRMHSAALGDTLGLLGTIAGLCFYNGLNTTTVKLMIIVGLVWITSPVASHLIMLMDISNGRYIAEGQDDSTDEQGLEGYSIDVKRKAMRQYDAENKKEGQK